MKQLSGFVLLSLIFSPIYVNAVGEDEGSSEPKTEPAQEYISQSDVTRDDYNTMKEYEITYDECLTDTSRQEVENYNDPRHVVDVAMKTCANKLEELNNWFTEKRFPPNFSRRYIRKISGESVRKTMPEIMFLMSRKQQ